MALIKYDLKVTIPEGVEVGRYISEQERVSLFGKPEVDTGKRSTPRLFLPGRADPLPERPSKSNREKLIALKERSAGLAQDIEERIDIIGEECKGLDYYFDPDKHPELASAVNAVFSGVNNKITFAMYKEALRLDNEIMLAITEEQISGII